MAFHASFIKGGIGAVAIQMASRLPPGCVELQRKVEKVCA